MSTSICANEIGLVIKLLSTDSGNMPSIILNCWFDISSTSNTSETQASLYSLPLKKVSFSEVLTTPVNVSQAI